MSPPAVAPPPHGGRVLWKYTRTGVILLSYFAVLELFRVTAGSNWHEVHAGSIYRAAHLSSPEIGAVAERFGIRSIINLRNNCTWEPWYQDETQGVISNQLQRYDINLSASQYPAPQELQKLYQALEAAPRPLYIHCRRGADRTGLASFLAALYEGDARITVEQAKQQLSLRKGH
ncbi:MAG TPA: tyrosine-protein phosphatase, partial [Gemmatales bacterium]|nr:tyrosine-protein phosphatase [Gemmatales bacterium]